MSIADWVVCLITTLLVIVLGGLPEKVTSALVERMATHKPIADARVVLIDQSGLPTTLPNRDILSWFNDGIFLGRVSLIHLRPDSRQISIQLQSPSVTYKLFPFRNEVGVIRSKAGRKVFYQIRSTELSAHLRAVLPSATSE